MSVQLRVGTGARTVYYEGSSQTLAVLQLVMTVIPVLVRIRYSERRLRSTCDLPSQLDRAQRTCNRTIPPALSELAREQDRRRLDHTDRALSVSQYAYFRTMTAQKLTCVTKDGPSACAWSKRQTCVILMGGNDIRTVLCWKSPCQC